MSSFLMAHDRIYLIWYVLSCPQPSSCRSKNEFCTKQSLWSFTTRYLTTWKSAASFGPYHSRPVAFWSLTALEHLQGPYHQQHIICLSRVWSGTTLRRASLQLSKPSDATYSARPVGQPGCGRRLPQPGRLTIGEELLGYHNNNSESLHLFTRFMQWMQNSSTWLPTFAPNRRTWAVHLPLGDYETTSTVHHRHLLLLIWKADTLIQHICLASW